MKVNRELIIIIIIIINMKLLSEISRRHSCGDLGVNGREM
jgi:hypothetical protein